MFLVFIVSKCVSIVFKQFTSYIYYNCKTEIWLQVCMLLCVHQKKKLCIINISRKWCHCNISFEKELSLKVCHFKWLNIIKYINIYCFEFNQMHYFWSIYRYWLNGIWKTNILSFDSNMHLQWQEYNRWNTEKLLLCMIELQKKYTIVHDIHPHFTKFY